MTKMADVVSLFVGVVWTAVGVAAAVLVLQAGLTAPRRSPGHPGDRIRFVTPR